MKTAREPDWLKRSLEDAAVSIASRGELLPPGGSYLPPHLWERLRAKLQGFYRRATGEPDAVLVILPAGFSIVETGRDPGADARKFTIGDRVTKVKGSRWTGHVVGFYSTKLTPVGYAVESETETGSVQIYPEAALSRSTREGKTE